MHEAGRQGVARTRFWSLNSRYGEQTDSNGGAVSRRYSNTQGLATSEGGWVVEGHVHSDLVLRLDVVA